MNNFFLKFPYGFITQSLELLSLLAGIYLVFLYFIVFLCLLYCYISHRILQLISRLRKSKLKKLSEFEYDFFIKEKIRWFNYHFIGCFLMFVTKNILLNSGCNFVLLLFILTLVYLAILTVVSSE